MRTVAPWIGPETLNIFPNKLVLLSSIVVSDKFLTQLSALSSRCK